MDNLAPQPPATDVIVRPMLRDSQVVPPPPRDPLLPLGWPPSLFEIAPARPVEWLWPGKLAVGHLTLLVGDPDVGKSLLALDLAARVTRGAAWPPESVLPHPQSLPSSPHSPTPTPQPPTPNPQPPTPSPPSRRPRGVLLFSAEDNLADTVRPRLEAAGADCRFVTALPPNYDADHPEEEPFEFLFPTMRPAAERLALPRPFDLRRDVSLFNELLKFRPNCRLAVFDPLSAYLDGVENLNADVRRLLAPLTAVAAQRGVAILAVSHLRKSPGRAIHRAIGSLGFVAAARSAWLLAKDPHEPQSRLLLPVKNNLAADSAGLSFTIAAAAPGGPPTIHWSPEPVTLSADELLPNAFAPGAPAPRRCPEREDAKEWLRRFLAAGPRPAALVHEHAEAHGLRRTTLRRAFRELAGQAYRDGYAEAGEWQWRLPVIPLPRREGATEHGRPEVARAQGGSPSRSE